MGRLAGSVDEAADWLRNKTGARRLVLCGVRLGATLAALAAARRDDVAGLLLLAPVLRGNSYMRQFLVSEQMRSGHTPAAGTDLEFYEFRFSPETVAQIRAIDLRQVQFPPGLKVAAFARGESRLVTECVHAWRASGVDVAQHDWRGLEPLLHYNILDGNKLADFSVALSWLQRAVPFGIAQQAAASPLEPAALWLPGCIETPLRFGYRGRLFGVLCRPAQGPTDSVVIIANAGRDPHYGGARHAVALARRFAAAGVASLRMDFAGLGDSLGAFGTEETMSQMFATDRRADIGDALDALEPLGFRHFAAGGLCAGAYHALRGALTDRRITALLLLNLPLFNWRRDMSLDYLTRRNRPAEHYAHRLVQAGTWTRLLGGKLDVMGVLRALYAQTNERLRAGLLALSRGLGLSTLTSHARRNLASLSRRGVRVLFLFSPGDGELAAFTQEFGSDGAGLTGFPGVAMRVVPGMDHDLSTSAGRHAAQALLVAFVTGAAEPSDLAEPAAASDTARA